MSISSVSMVAGQIAGALVAVAGVSFAAGMARIGPMRAAIWRTEKPQRAALRRAG
jgi:hypothetical protein